MVTDDLLQQGIAALKAGHKAEARNLLTQVVEQDQYNEIAWLWLSGAVEADDDKRTCLENVLAINPNNTAAKRGLAMIQQQQVGQALQPVLTTLEPTTAQPQPSQPAAPPPSIEANHYPKNVPHTVWPPRSKRKKATRRWAGIDPMLVVGIGGVGLVLVVCVVLAGIWWAIDSGLLQLGPAVPADVDTTQVPSAPNATSVPTDTPRPSIGKWRTRFDTSSFDDSQTVVLRLEAESQISGWLATFTPVLMLRCQEHKVEAFVNVGMQQDVEYGTDNSTVRIRFDSDRSQTQEMSHSTDGEALFFRHPIEMIAAMMQHDKMVFGFTPFNASPVETTFDLRGLEEAAKPLLQTCGIDLSDPKQPPAPLPVGSSITVNDFQVQGERVLIAESLTNSTGIVQEATGRFAIVFMAVTNHASSPHTFVPFRNLDIRDAEGRQFEQDTLATFDVQLQYGTDFGLDINPNETAHMVVVYDISEQSSFYVLGPGARADPYTQSVLLDVP